MLPATRERIERHMLASGKTESPETREDRRRSIRRMEKLGLDFDRFASGPEAARDEGDAFLARIALAWEQAEAIRVRRGLPPGRRRTSGRGNYTRVLHMVRDAFGHDPYKVRWSHGRRPSPRKDVFTLDEMRAVIPVPRFKRRDEETYRKRFLKEVALVTGRRPSELQRLEDADLFPQQSVIRLAKASKNNPDGLLVPVERELWRQDRAFMAWVRKRPVAKSNPRALMVKTDKRTGVARVMSKAELQKELAEVGKEAGVRFNATRCRHTRIAAWLAQGKRVYEVKTLANHSGFHSLPAYIEFVESGMAAHLARPTWFREIQTRETWAASRKGAS